MVRAVLALLSLVATAQGFMVSRAVPSRAAARPVSAAATLSMMERTYIMIKPDGVQRGLVGTIIGRFEQKGYKLQALKLFQASEDLLKTHYGDLVSKPFFPKLLEYMLSGPVTCMVWEGKEAVKTGRQMLGATNPLESLPGTIRGDFSIEVGRNICHGSDSVENAEKEIALCESPREPGTHTPLATAPAPRHGPRPARGASCALSAARAGLPLRWQGSRPRRSWSGRTTRTTGSTSERRAWRGRGSCA